MLEGNVTFEDNLQDIVIKNSKVNQSEFLKAKTFTSTTLNVGLIVHFLMIIIIQIQMNMLNKKWLVQTENLWCIQSHTPGTTSCHKILFLLWSADT